MDLTYIICEEHEIRLCSSLSGLVIHNLSLWRILSEIYLRIHSYPFNALNTFFVFFICSDLK